MSSVGLEKASLALLMCPLVAVAGTSFSSLHARFFQPSLMLIIKTLDILDKLYLLWFNNSVLFGFYSFLM